MIDHGTAPIRPGAADPKGSAAIEVRAW